MKVLVVLVVALASVAAKGSGPYLPSGWKPEGPAFYLPSEIVKPSASPIADLILDGSEASGSENLREYGPPVITSQSVVEENSSENPTADLDNSEASGSDSLREYGPPALSENIINQGLPDAVTEKNFDAEIKFSTPEATVEVSEEQEAVTESAEQTTLAINIDFPIIENKEVEAQATVESTETSSAVIQFENVLSQDNVEVGEVSEAETQTTESANQDVTVSGTATDLPVQNIPDIITSIANEIASEQVEIKDLSTQALSGSLEQAPEGFLEYGPPGFTEYGPPKDDLASNDSNAARRRRFSPKFRSSKKH